MASSSQSVASVLSTLLGLPAGQSVEDPSRLVVEVIKAVNAYPLANTTAGVDHALLCAEYPAFQSAVERQQARIAALLERVVDKIEPGVGPAAAAELQTGEDMEVLPAFLDRLREAAESYIDEARGHHSSQQIAVLQSGTPGLGAGAGSSGAKSSNARRAGPISVISYKPQASFDGAIDNARGTVFAHSVAGAAASSSTSSSSRLNQSSSSRTAAAAQRHPLAEENSNLAYPEKQLARVSVPQPFSPLDDVECTYVDTPGKLMSMLDYLEGTAAAGSGGGLGSEAALDDLEIRLPCSPSTGCAPVQEIAIDLEAHSLRSFQGFCCLMQLSSRRRDFLVDALALRSHLHVLNRVTTDPRIVKVLHGCDSDVVWLQRDFGVYMLNVFDTGQAARVLAYPSFGLAFLLSKFPQVTANKEFQMADWRQRPLPPALLKYAREDTHYLLGIYDRVKNDLIDSSATKTAMRVRRGDAAAGGGSASVDAAVCEVPNLLAAVLERSAERSLLLYTKEAFDARAYRKLMLRMGLNPGGDAPGQRQEPAAAATSARALLLEDDLETGGADALGTADLGGAAEDGGGLPPRTRVFAALFDWRDACARREDESPHYVLPNRLLARLSECMPTSIDELVKASHPLPPLLRTHAAELVALISAAVRNEALQQPRTSLGGPLAASSSSAAAAAAAPSSSASSSPALVAAGSGAPATAQSRKRGREPAAAEAAPSSRQASVEGAPDSIALLLGGSAAPEAGPRLRAPDLSGKLVTSMSESASPAEAAPAPLPTGGALYCDTLRGVFSLQFGVTLRRSANPAFQRVFAALQATPLLQLLGHRPATASQAAQLPAAVEEQAAEASIDAFPLASDSSLPLAGAAESPEPAAEQGDAGGPPNAPRIQSLEEAFRRPKQQQQGLVELPRIPSAAAAEKQRSAVTEEIAPFDYGSAADAMALSGRGSAPAGAGGGGRGFKAGGARGGAASNPFIRRGGGGRGRGGGRGGK